MKNNKIFSALMVVMLIVATILAFTGTDRVSAAGPSRSDKPATTGLTVTLIPETTEVEIVKPFEIKSLDFSIPPTVSKIKKGPGNTLSEGRITIKNISAESYRADLFVRPIQTTGTYPEIGISYEKLVSGARVAGPVILKPGEEVTLVFKATVNWGNIPLATFKGLTMDIFANPPIIDEKG